jgi:hypothetical protein
MPWTLVDDGAYWSLEDSRCKQPVFRNVDAYVPIHTASHPANPQRAATKV